MERQELRIRPYLPQRDSEWATAVLDRDFGGRLQARRGELIDVLHLAGFVAERKGRPVGLLTYRVDGEECELAFLVSMEQGRGVGTALVQALKASVVGYSSIWLVTTNDNLRALRFYQRRGFALRALRPGAVDEARRRLKPALPLIGQGGIPMRDELELEARLRYPHEPELGRSVHFER